MPVLSRFIVQTLCTLGLVALLCACGASSVVDALKPTRVIGLGDAYNDRNATVTGTGDAAVTVVDQVAALFGFPVSKVVTYAEIDALIAPTATVFPGLAASTSLAQQIDKALVDVGGQFTKTDLIVLSIGTRDLIAGVPVATAVADLSTQVARLLAAKARHVLIMQPLDFTYTPWGRSNATYATLYAGKTVAFNAAAAASLQRLVSSGGYLSNPVIFGGTNLSSDFNIYASPSTSANGRYLEFNTSTQVPYCPTPAQLSGCAVQNTSAGVPNFTYATTLFADNLNLTPAGNRWVAQRMFNATAQGWR